MALITITRCPPRASSMVTPRPRRAGRIVQRAQHAMVAVDLGDQVALIPDMVAGGDAVGAGLVELGGDLRGDAESAGGVLAIDDDKIGVQPAAQHREMLQRGPPAAAADHIAQEQDTHDILASRARITDRSVTIKSRIWSCSSTRDLVHLLVGIGDADRQHRSAGPQISGQGAIVEAGAVADTPAGHIERQHRDEHHVGSVIVPEAMTHGGTPTPKAASVSGAHLAARGAEDQRAFPTGHHRQGAAMALDRPARRAGACTSISSRIGAYPATIAPGADGDMGEKAGGQQLGGGRTAQPGMGPPGASAVASWRCSRSCAGPADRSERALAVEVAKPRRPLVILSPLGPCFSRWAPYTETTVPAGTAP